MEHIAIDQTRVVIDPDLVAKGALPFPRPLTWWQRTLPVWVDASETDDGLLILSPNGHIADGRVLELTPADRRRHVKQIMRYLTGRRLLDFSNAIVNS